jgi:DNA-binding IclR family transcriptional regulator
MVYKKPLKKESGAERDTLFIASLDKGLAVLDALGASGESLGLAELVNATGLDKSSVQRLTYTLNRAGYLDKDPQARRFRLAPKVLELAFYYLRSNPLIEAATPALVELRRNCGERVNLSLFDGTSIIYAIRQQPKREFFYTSLIGRRIPTFCAAGGRAMLACLPDEEARGILERSNMHPLTPKTIIDPDLIWRAILEARAKTYAIASEETAVGELTIAAAVTNHSGRPEAAVHIAGSLAEWTSAEFEQRFAPLVVETARSLSRQLTPR